MVGLCVLVYVYVSVTRSGLRGMSVSLLRLHWRMKLYLCRSVGETVWYAVVFTSSPLRPHAAATFIFKFAFSARVFHRTNTFSAQMCLVAIFFFCTDADGVAEKPFKKCFLKSNCLFIVYKERMLFEEKRLQYLSGSRSGPQSTYFWPRVKWREMAD